jgi:hypothetical protein
MPQLQLPIFPAGVTEINSRIAVQKEGGRVCYIHGHLAVFQHEEQDVQSFRLFTSQTIAGGTVKPKEIVRTFGVPMVTVKRYMKLYRDCGSKGFYGVKPRHSSASVLKGAVLEQAQRLLDEGRSMPEFQTTCDVAQGGVRLALPALLAAGLLRCTPGFYQLPNGFYGIESVFLLLGLMALAHPFAGTTSLPGAGRVGQTAGAGSHSGSAHVTRKIEAAVPGYGASGAVERRTGQGMDGSARRCGTLFLLRRPCACV